jgi:CDP-diacylglycerol--serine O-phosphatidyltransferase
MTMHKPRPRLSALPLNRLIPNILTVTALCAGLTAILYGFQGKWQWAVAAVAVAALLDALDGRVARLLGGSSRFGAELDSLSDFISFGVAPGILVFQWTLHDLRGAGWVIALVFAVCAALRLARFNTRLDASDQPAWAANFFTGVPAPAGGGLALLPMILSFEIGEAFFRHPLLNAVMVVLVAYLMISRFPTYSFKRVRVPQRFVVLLLLIFGLLAALVATAPWLTLSALLVVYLCTLPLSLRGHQRLSASDEGAGDALSVIDSDMEGDDASPDDDADDANPGRRRDD